MKAKYEILGSLKKEPLRVDRVTKNAITGNPGSPDSETGMVENTFRNG